MSSRALSTHTTMNAGASRAPRSSKPVGRVGGGFAMPEHKKLLPSDHITHPSVLNVFHPERDAKSATPYHQQGDPAMETAEAQMQRQLLRAHPAVVDAVARFARLYRLDAEGLIGPAEYVRVQLAVARVLIPTMGAAEARATAVDDWETDRAGADRLDYSRLFSAVFEMADLWCPGLAVEEYVSFLDALEFRARGALAEIDALETSSYAAARRA